MYSKEQEEASLLAGSPGRGANEFSGEKRSKLAHKKLEKE